MSEKLKKILISIFAFPLIIIAPAPAFALNLPTTAVNSANPRAVTNSTAQSATKGANVEDKVANLKTRADQEIDRRVASLTSAITKVNDMKKLSDSQKNTYINNLNSEISSLTTLKTKIESDTDLSTLKTDVQSIVKDYRVYLVYLPQTRILATVDRINTTADLLASESSQLATKITTAKTTGQDTTTLEALLSDMNAKIADARTQAANASSLVSSLTPQGYPGNKTTMESARIDIKNAIQDLISAHKDGLSVAEGLKQNTTTATESAK